MPDEDHGVILTDLAPHAVKRIHLVGVAGTGMGAFAGMLKAAGYRVTGSDENVYPPMSDMLREWGIDVFTPYAPGNLDRAQPDLVIIGNVIRRVNPEATAVRERRIPQMSFPGRPRRAHPGRPAQRRHHRHAREDHHLGADGARAGGGGTRSDVPRRWRDGELRRQLPARRRQARRGGGRRVRHRVLRQGPQVPALPRTHGTPHQHRIRSRRHLQRHGAVRVGLRAILRDASRRRLAWRERVVPCGRWRSRARIRLRP